MDLSNIIPLLSNLNKNTQQNETHTNQTTNQQLGNIYPDTSIDGKNIQATNTQQNKSNCSSGFSNILNLLPTLLSGNQNIDLSAITNMLSGTKNEQNTPNILSSLFNQTKKEEKKNSLDISEFVKIDEYEIED